MKKMNGLFVAAFVLALVGMACALGAMTLAYLVKNIELAVLAGAGGALCVFVGIILAYNSKPKKNKKRLTTILRYDTIKLLKGE
ncbi:MAG: hypothetical protein IIY61_07380 [Ruminococcus sp.]|nr:hypothetical protein [Ruminococcus sp.]